MIEMSKRKFSDFENPEQSTTANPDLGILIHRVDHGVIENTEKMVIYLNLADDLQRAGFAQEANIVRQMAAVAQRHIEEFAAIRAIVRAR